MNGLVWEKNKWSAASGGVPSSRLVKRERLNGWAQRGMACTRPPVRWRYPDLYEINGTNYTKVGVEGYRSSDWVSLYLINQHLEMNSDRWVSLLDRLIFEGSRDPERHFLYSTIASNACSS